MKIIPLSEGSFTIDQSKLFVPFDLEKDKLEKRSTGSLLVEIQPFVIVTSRDVLLLDTGLGFAGNTALQLYENLLKNGIDPFDITRVLMSHLHKDHAGGVSFKDDFGNRRLTFPNATYYIQQREIGYALEKGAPSYIAEELEILNHAENVHFLHDDRGTIDGYIHYEVTAGHSPFHQVFRITEEDKVAFFGGDDAPQLQQMKSRFVAKYDYDGKKCMELRQSWWETGREHNWTFLFYHDVKNPVWPGLTEK